MKPFILIMIINLHIGNLLFSQDVHVSQYGNFLGATAGSGDPIQPTFTGEYEIYLEFMPWVDQKLIDPGSQLNLLDFDLSYEIELISFPFSPSCPYPTLLDADGGCNQPVDRILTVPPDSYYETLNARWDYFNTNGAPIVNKFLLRKTPLKNFQRHYWDPGKTQSKSAISLPDNPNTLVSAGFSNIVGIHLDRSVLPHSVLKHTVNLHCGSITEPIIQSFSWITDLTRGRMREYPYNYTGISQSQDHDIVARPRIIYNTPSQIYDNRAIANCMERDWSPSIFNCHLDDPNSNREGIGINYFPNTTTSDDLCVQIPNNANADEGDFAYDGFRAYSLPLPEYSLVTSSQAREKNGLYYSGYKNVGNTLQLQGNSPPKVLQFYVNENISIDLINSSEKIIYNPSEVNVTADNLRFPPHYQFRTVRGIYPRLSEIAAADIAENRGPFNDPTFQKVPVVTDLGPDWHISDYTINDPKYSSIYRLLNGSKLIISPCVSIFDATFDVQIGSEIIFENWPSTVNPNRFVIDYHGGTVTKRDGQFLFQDLIETRKILKYEAADYIYAGNNVDPSTSNGDYIVDIGSNVSFIAENEVRLDIGFEAKNNAEFLAKVQPVLLPPCPARFQNPVNLNNNKSILGVLNEITEISFSPNPVTTGSNLKIELAKESILNAFVTDMLGRQIETIVDRAEHNIGIYTYYLDAVFLKPGIYNITVQTENSTKSLIFVKQ